MLKDDFRESLLRCINDYLPVLMTGDRDWTVKGFIDIYKNIYSISLDTKVISKILELMLFPMIQQFAEDHGLEIVLSKAQNFYPDIIFITPGGRKIALDIKSTYRRSATRVSGFTLGAFTGYFRFRDKAKNITFPYNEYDKHYVLGIIYTKQGELIDESCVYTIDDLKEILSVIRDVEFVLREKYQIAADRPGSGNTKNIGSATKIEELRDGTGVFARYGVEVFDDYWMYYLTNDMARQAQLAKPPYRNLEGYFEYKGGTTARIKEPSVEYFAPPQLELPFVADIEKNPLFPSTRFQGSKLKLVDWIWDNIKDLQLDTALDAFGGTGCVSHRLKREGKQVTYNDVLKFNYYIGLALIENDEVTLSSGDVDFLLQRHEGVDYPTFIYDTFPDIYFTDEENSWLDMVVKNIELLGDGSIEFAKVGYKRALAYFALFQACTIKRPYNLFHRKNLYIRTSEVERSFGNKTAWDTPFPNHFLKFISEANDAVFSNGRQNVALNEDGFDVKGEFDLVYIDTPYISNRGVGVDYLDFYHFLEGIVNYEAWGEKIDYRTKHRKWKQAKGIWSDRNSIHSAFDQLFRQFQDSTLVVSYRADGIPSIEELMDMLKRYKRGVTRVAATEYKYALSVNHSQEVLLIAL